MIGTVESVESIKRVTLNFSYSFKCLDSILEHLLGIDDLTAILTPPKNYSKNLCLYLLKLIPHMKKYEIS